MSTTAFWLARDSVPAFRALSLSRSELEALARRRLHALLEVANLTSYYAPRLTEAGLASGKRDEDSIHRFRMLPTFSKSMLREAGTGILVGGRVRPEWRSSRSSGSTGEPFAVYYDPRAWVTLKYLVKLRSRAACGMRVHDRVALLDAVPVKPPSLLPLERARRLRTISVLQSAERVAASLREFRPHAILSLPSALLDAGRVLRESGAMVRPRMIFTTGELLQPSVRQGLTNAFGCEVFDVYGTSETKEIAWQCAEGRMHVNSDVVLVEIVGENDRPAAPGEEGDIVVTSLVNRAMPMLRYRTGDRGSLLPDGCPCGVSSPCLGVVTGREADVLVLEGGRRLSPYVLTSALERVTGLQRYQVTQLARQRLRVRVIASSLADRTAIAEGVDDMLRGEVGESLRVEVEFVDRFEPGPRGKFRIVQPLG